MRPLFLTVFGGLTVLVIAAIIFLLTQDAGGPVQPAADSAAESVRIGGPFELTDENGNRFTEANLRGRPTAIFFGFSHCPDVCPTTLYELSVLLGQLGDDADRLNVVFVSVDWERDGPEEVLQYTSVFDPRIIGLAGTEAEIVAATTAYHVYYARVPMADGTYTIDHTASVFLMDSNVEFVGTLSYQEDMATRLAKLQRLVAGV